MEIKIFELKEEHLKLLRSMLTMWNENEFSAPMIDPKKPYGNSDPYKDIAKILDIKGFIDSNQEIHFSSEQIELMYKLHRETETALQIVLVTGKFESGKYVSKNYADWIKLRDLNNKFVEKRKTLEGIELIS